MCIQARYVESMLCVLFTAAALAGGGIAAPRSGWWVDAGAGIGLSAPLLAAWPLGDASIGAWFGPYDDDYAIGRYTGVGVGVRPGVLGTPSLPGAALIEVRRGLDLLVVGAHVFAAAGPMFDGDHAALIEVGGGAKGRFRPTGRYVGWQVRARAGAAIGQGVAAEAGLTLGVELASPWGASR